MNTCNEDLFVSVGVGDERKRLTVFLERETFLTKKCPSVIKPLAPRLRTTLPTA
jgi:hypothetical protein